MAGIILLGSVTTSPASAVTVSWSSYRQPDNTVWYCAVDSTQPGSDQPTEYTMDLITWALDATWDYYTPVTFTRMGVNQCGPHDPVIRVVPSGTNPMRYHRTYNSITGSLVKTEIDINIAVFTNAWLSTTPMSCTVGFMNGCKMDFVAMAVHEFGHSLGLNDLGAWNDRDCAAGYASTAWGAACSGNGDHIMYAGAGAEWQDAPFPGYDHQGYRHGIDPHELDAVNAAY